ncbi:hypothetical protein ACH4NO_03790 [Streptomyces olivaceus]|uniref:hypothetical protein n=1 Tax=Streptomyces olivaceus TaxID=47716 RepID=UPI0037AA8EE1
MFRGSNARLRIPLLAALLMALQFLAPSASFAIAHTHRDVMANAQSGIIASGPSSHEERVACHDTGRSGHPHGPARVRGDRHRATTAPRPELPEHSLRGQRDPAADTPLLSGGAAGPRSRAAADHSPATLQVFRC